MKSNDVLRAVVVDDHPMFREAVKRTLSNAPGFEVVAEGANAEQAIEYVQDLMPDLVLLDISMPGGGIEAASKIHLTCPVVKIVMLTASENEDDVMRSIEAGANGYVLKGAGGNELVGILTDICAGEAYISPELAARMLSAFKRNLSKEAKAKVRLDTLTTREEQILGELSRGFSNREIGTKLRIAEKTVKHYVTNILQKLQVRNRVEAALLAQKHNQD